MTTPRDVVGTTDVDILDALQGTFGLETDAALNSLLNRLGITSLAGRTPESATGRVRQRLNQLFVPFAGTNPTVGTGGRTLSLALPPGDVLGGTPGGSPVGGVAALGRGTGQGNALGNLFQSITQLLGGGGQAGGQGAGGVPMLDDEMLQQLLAELMAMLQRPSPLPAVPTVRRQ